MPIEVALWETMIEQSLASGALSHLSTVLHPLLIYQEDTRCESTQMMSVLCPASKLVGDQISCTCKYKRLHFLMLILYKGNFVGQLKCKENLVEPSGMGLPAPPKIIPRRTLSSDRLSTVLIELNI